MKKLASKKELEVMSLNNTEWEIIKGRFKDIEAFLKEGESPEDIGLLMFNSLRLVTAELLVNREKYDKYPAKNYTEEDFVDLVIESIVESSPSLDDREGSLKYIDDIRKIMWGYVKNDIKKISSLLISLVEDVEQKITDPVSQENMKLLIRCLTIVYVEILLRQRELQILELSFL